VVVAGIVIFNILKLIMNIVPNYPTLSNTFLWHVAVQTSFDNIFGNSVVLSSYHAKLREKLFTD
jgi:hypothetical protein